MNFPWIVGVDPGGKHTGICLLDPGGVPAWWSLVTREEDGDLQPHILESVEACIKARAWMDGGAYVYAIEGINPPTPQMGLTSVVGILDTAQVLGALRFAFRNESSLVPPAGHGSKPLQAYPSLLHGEREKKGSGKMRHVRSAFDVAKAHRRTMRLTGTVTHR